MSDDCSENYEPTDSESIDARSAEHAVLVPLTADGPVLTCVDGTNADLFAEVAQFYLRPGDRVADVTFGRGTFWKNLATNLYDLVQTDLVGGIDFRSLPYEDASLDALVLDPPYMHGGKTVKASINDLYRNENTSHESIVALYLGGFLEARRTLRRDGLLFVKTQPEIESGKQRMTHMELATVLPMIGFRIEDEFVLHSSAVPAMREQYQKHARKNHSFLYVARLTR